MVNSVITAVGSNETLWTATNCNSAVISNVVPNDRIVSSSLTVDGRDILQELDEV